jgi:hypothetical protein
MGDPENREVDDLNALEPLKRDPEETRNIIKYVLKLEQERLYLQRPHLNEDVIQIIKREVK